MKYRKARSITIFCATLVEKVGSCFLAVEDYDRLPKDIKVNDIPCQRRPQHEIEQQIRTIAYHTV